MKTYRLPWLYRAVATFLIPLQLLTGPMVQAWATDCANEPSVDVSSLPPLPSAPESVRVFRRVPPISVPPVVPGIRQAPALRFSEAPADAEFLSCRVFLEPLVPLGGGTNAAVNRDLAEALRTFALDPSAETTSVLESYLSKHLKSPWRLALLANLGGIYRRGGYWSKALAAWGEVAANLSALDDKRGLDLVERATAEYAELLARLGRADELTRLIGGLKGRELKGAAAEKLAQAKGSLQLMQTIPEKSFRCGPFAAGRVFAALEPGKPLPIAIHDSVCTPKGTSLSQVREFAERIGIKYQVAHRSAGADVLVPSVVHWKEGHFAAIVRKGPEGRFVIEDPTFTDTIAVASRALDEEGSGYYLVRSGALPPGWASVTDEEASKVWGKGAVPTNGDAVPPCVGFDIECQPCEEPQVGLATYSVDPVRVNLRLSDTPISYGLPRGGAMRFTVHYSQRDVAPSSTPLYSHVGPQWNLNWIAYVIDDPGNSNTKSYGPGGGTLKYSGYNSTTQEFAPQSLTRVRLKRTSATSYEKNFPDGSRQVFGLADTSVPKRIFLTESYDAAGNKTTFNYDVNFRLSSVVDPMGQPVLLTYVSDAIANVADYYRVKTASSLGRTATFEYDGSNRLWKIKDPIGMTSQFDYDGTGTFISALTTPYGTTKFKRDDSANDRRLDITDPLGGTERIEFRWSDASAVPDNASIMPIGMTPALDTTLWQYRNSYYWDKKAFAEDPFDTAKAHLYHWLEDGAHTSTVDVLESYKAPLTRRVFFTYPGQTYSHITSGSNQPNAIARVLDNGKTELTRFAYNSLGNVTKMVTPSDESVPARITTVEYAANGIDVLKVFQRRSGGQSLDTEGQSADLLGQFTYDASSKRQPKTSVDAAGQTTTYTYNSFGQVLSVTNAKAETTTFTYDRDDDNDSVSDGYLRYVDEPVANTRTQFWYDGFGRLYSMVDPESAVTTFYYEAEGGDQVATLNRVKKVLYPDGATEEFEYHRLNLRWMRDPQNRFTEYFHNALGQVEAVRDPSGLITKYRWCKCGSLAELIDAKNQVTKWNRDTMGRVTSKVYADNRTVRFTYQPASGRLETMTDARNQVTAYQYRIDGLLSGITYTNAVVPTPNISLSYDIPYGRLATITAAAGTTVYGYHPVAVPAALGAGALASIDGPWVDDTIAYTYDQLGRPLTRQINGAANTSSVVYDSLGRVTSTTTLQGATNLAYVGTTGRLDYVDLPNTQRVDFDYYPQYSGDGSGNGGRRLKQIRNLNVGAGGSGSVISQFDYSFNLAGMITGWTQQQGGASQQWAVRYDNSDRLISAVVKTGTGTLVSENYFRHDDGDNRTLEQAGQAPMSAPHNNVNQRTSESAGGLLAITGAVNEAASMKVAGQPVSPDAAGNFAASAPVNVGSNSIEIRAKDVSGNETVKTINVNVTASTGRNYTYDENGNQTSATGYTGLSGGDRTYEWDAADRLAVINYSGTAKKTKFTYDSMGRWVRIAEEDNGVATSEKRLVWEGLAIVEERDANNTVTRRYFGVGEERSGTHYYYLRDHLGNIREVTNNVGAIQAQYAYDAWGRRTKTVGAGVFDFGFTGHYHHSESGLVLAPLRAYDPEQARWISRDPLEEDGGINLYAYCIGDPVNYVDPNGAWLVPALQILGGLFLAFVGNYYYQNNIRPQIERTVGPGAADAADKIKQVLDALALKKLLKDGTDLVCSLRKKGPGPSVPDGPDIPKPKPSRQKGQRMTDQDSAMDQLEGITRKQEKQRKERPKVKGENQDWEGFKRPKSNDIFSKQKSEQRAKQRDYERDEN